MTTLTTDYLISDIIGRLRPLPHARDALVHAVTHPILNRNPIMIW